MRIGVNTRVLLSNRMEGVCRFIHETLRRLVVKHPEHQFVFFFDRPFDEQFIYADNVTPVIVSPPARHPFLHFIWFEYSLVRAMKNHKIDVFFSPDTYASLRTTVPTLLVCHDIAYQHYPNHLPFLIKKYYQYFFPRFHHKADQILAVSSFTRQDIISAYHLNPKKVKVAYNSVKDGLRPVSENVKSGIRAKYTGGEEFFLYVGSIHPRKNVVRLLEAFTRFKKETNSPKKLLLVSRMAWKTKLFESELAKSPYAADIIIQQELYDQEVNLITASAFCLIYVSLFEGFGLPILEAMHCDVPVICSNVSSMPEVAGDACIMVDPTDVGQIAAALVRVHNEKDLRETLVCKSKVQRQKFNWDDTVELISQSLSHLHIGGA